MKWRSLVAIVAWIPSLGCAGSIRTVPLHPLRGTSTFDSAVARHDSGEGLLEVEARFRKYRGDWFRVDSARLVCESIACDCPVTKVRPTVDGVKMTWDLNAQAIELPSSGWGVVVDGSWVVVIEGGESKVERHVTDWFDLPSDPAH